jgi:hypothetical protein
MGELDLHGDLQISHESKLLWAFVAIPVDCKKWQVGDDR